MEQSSALKIRTVDSSPKWFTQVDLDLREGWAQSVIEYLPTLDYDETPFTRIEFQPFAPAITPPPIPGA